MKTVGTLNYRNFVKENHIRILGLMLKRKISTSTILSSFLFASCNGGENKIFILKNCKNSNICNNIKNIFS